MFESALVVLSLELDPYMGSVTEVKEHGLDSNLSEFEGQLKLIGELVWLVWLISLQI
jgi:hypothetical protein